MTKALKSNTVLTTLFVKINNNDESNELVTSAIVVSVGPRAVCSR